eukprot:Skav206957  [mRNA]  locus=scaffold6419:69755:70488:- [translate_table: standard]
MRRTPSNFTQNSARPRLVSVVLAIVVLLLPHLVSFWLVLPCVVFPYLVLAMLAMASCAKVTTSEQCPAASAGCCVSVPAAAGFSALGLMTGTIGEALTDSATTLALRSELKAGNSDLALANHLTVLSSMSLAFWTQSKSERSAGKQVLCMLLWTGCQIFRIAALPYLGQPDEVGRARYVALATMVFLDRG